MPCRGLSLLRLLVSLPLQLLHHSVRDCSPPYYGLGSCSRVRSLATPRWARGPRGQGLACVRTSAGLRSGHQS